MKRKAAVCMAAAAVLAVLSIGCEAPASAYEKLWSVDIGQEGFARTGASRTVGRQGADMHFLLSISPHPVQKDESADAKVLRANSKEYYARDRAVFWDGVDDNGNWIGGTQYTRRIAWEGNGLSYSLFAETFEEGASLDIASPETAAMLEDDPLAGLAGFEITSDIWWVEFGNRNITASITLFTPQLNETTIRSILGEGGYLPMKEDGMEYYSRGGGKKADETLVSSMLWRTNMGVFRLDARVPWIYRNDVPEDALDFIHPELAKSITEQMGGKIVPFGETR